MTQLRNYSVGPRSKIINQKKPREWPVLLAITRLSVTSLTI